MSHFLNFLLLILLVLGSATSQAQNYPVYNSFYVNPFLYNPAEAATEFTHVYVLHRRQWMGVDGAPVLSSVTFNTLLNETRVGIGGKFSSYKRGILETSDFTISYAYGIPLGKTNWLFFGLSGGAISNTVDITQLTPEQLTDPAIANYLSAENNFQPVANFGMLFRSESGLNFGVSLPQLFTPKYNTATFSNTAISPADQIFATLYYKKKVAGKIVSRGRGNVRKRVKTSESVAPLEFYVNYKYSAFDNSQFEFLSKLNLSPHFWVGASYRLPYGFTGNIGIQSSKFVFSYAYEPGTQPEPGFSSGSHEVLLGLKLGERKNFKRQVPELRSTLRTVQERHTARFQETVEDPDQINQTQTGKRKKYYVVIRAFSDFAQADAYKRKLISDKYNADVMYNPEDRKYYVHVLETEKSAEAHEEARNLKNYTKLKEARVLTITVDE